MRGCNRRADDERIPSNSGKAHLHELCQPCPMCHMVRTGLGSVRSKPVFRNSLVASGTEFLCTSTDKYRKCHAFSNNLHSIGKAMLSTFGEQDMYVKVLMEYTGGVRLWLSSPFSVYSVSPVRRRTALSSPSMISWYSTEVTTSCMNMETRESRRKSETCNMYTIRSCTSTGRLTPALLRVTLQTVHITLVSEHVLYPNTKEDSRWFGDRGELRPERAF